MRAAQTRAHEKRAHERRATAPAAPGPGGRPVPWLKPPRLDAPLPDPYALPPGGDRRLRWSPPRAGRLALAGSRACAPKRRCTTAPTAPSARTGRSRASTTSRPSTWTTRPSRRSRRSSSATRRRVPDASFIGTDGPAPRCRAQGRAADRRAAPAREPRAAHPPARGGDPRRSARRRTLRLGAGRVHRADDADARDALRLPLRGPPQAALLVRRRDSPARRGLRVDEHRRRGAPRRSSWRCTTTSSTCGRSARRSPATTSSP